MPELGQSVGQLDININDGSEYVLDVTYKVNGVAVDVTGYTAEFTIRGHAGQTGTPLLQLTELSGIVVGTTDGKFTITISSTQSAFGNSALVYNLDITPPAGDKNRLLQGECKSWAGV